jgi:hypothetical protein
VLLALLGNIIIAAEEEDEESGGITKVKDGVICSQVLRNSAAVDAAYDSGFHCKASEFRRYNGTDSVGDQCNFFDPAGAKPWPEGCKLY